MATLLSAHRDLADPAHRAEVAALWGVADVPANPGSPRSSCSTRWPHGAVKMVWIACTNPAQSMPDQATVRARSRAPSSSCCRRRTPTPKPRRSPTCCCPRRRGARRKAPSPTPSGASRACALRSRRRARRARTGRSLPISRAASKRACGPACRRCFPYASAAEVFDEHARIHARARPRHHGALVREARRDGPQQWPCREGDERGRRGFTPTACFATADGRARFAAAKYVARRRARRRALSVPPQHRPPARPVARHEPDRHGRRAVRACAASRRSSCIPRTSRDAASRTATSCASSRDAAASSCR